MGYKYRNAPEPRTKPMPGAWRFYPVGTKSTDPKKINKSGTPIGNRVAAALASTLWSKGYLSDGPR